MFFWKLLIAVAGRKHKKILVNYSKVLYFNTTIFLNPVLIIPIPSSQKHQSTMDPWVPSVQLALASRGPTCGASSRR